MKRKRTQQVRNAVIFGGMKKGKISLAERPMLFEIEPEPLEEKLTALGGLPLLVQAFRSLEVGASVKEQVRIRQRERGYDEPTMVESFVLLNGAGGSVWRISSSCVRMAYWRN